MALPWERTEQGSRLPERKEEEEKKKKILWPPRAWNNKQEEKEKWDQRSRSRSRSRNDYRRSQSQSQSQNQNHSTKLALRPTLPRRNSKAGDKPAYSWRKKYPVQSKGSTTGEKDRPHIDGNWRARQASKDPHTSSSSSPPQPPSSSSSPSSHPSSSPSPVPPPPLSPSPPSSSSPPPPNSPAKSPRGNRNKPIWKLSEEDYTAGRIVYIPKRKANHANGHTSSGTSSGSGIGEHPAIIMKTPAPGKDEPVEILNCTTFGDLGMHKWRHAKNPQDYENIFAVIYHPDAMGERPRETHSHGPASVASAPVPPPVLYLKGGKAMAKQSYVDSRQGLQKVPKDMLVRYVSDGFADRHMEEASLEKLRRWVDKREGDTCVDEKALEKPRKRCSAREAPGVDGKGEAAATARTEVPVTRTETPVIAMAAPVTTMAAPAAPALLPQSGRALRGRQKHFELADLFRVKTSRPS